MSFFPFAIMTIKVFPVMAFDHDRWALTVPHVIVVIQRIARSDKLQETLGHPDNELTEEALNDEELAGRKEQLPFQQLFFCRLINYWLILNDDELAGRKEQLPFQQWTATNTWPGICYIMTTKFFSLRTWYPGYVVCLLQFRLDYASYCDLGNQQIEILTSFKKNTKKCWPLWEQKETEGEAACQSHTCHTRDSIHIAFILSQILIYIVNELVNIWPC